jgi:hypothetical protein
MHDMLLRHLVPLDWEYRLQTGELPHPADYQRRFPAAEELIQSLHGELNHLPAPKEPLPQRLGSYRLCRQLGRGGMGIVFEAVQEPAGQSVALKVLPRVDLADPHCRERFWREAHTTARLQTSCKSSRLASTKANRSWRWS